MGEFGLAIAAAIAATIIKSGIRVDREYERGVIFHLGRFQQIPKKQLPPIASRLKLTPYSTIELSIR
jgi:regulator of protease activity HflC (stomatin/prohibitin superfamily)